MSASIVNLGATPNKFVDGLREACRACSATPKNAAFAFLGYCDPLLGAEPRFPVIELFILERVFPGRLALAAIRRIPRPYRELMALYQAWGILTSDGILEYLGSTNAKYDLEVDRGLELVGGNQAKGLLSELRKSKSSDQAGSIEEEFLNSMPDFESHFLGAKLLDLLFATSKD